MMGRKISIMGVVNVTDDSFYSGSRCSDPASAIRRMTEMLSAGADIIDLGACSTRPGSVPPDEDEEWRRLLPVLEEVAGTMGKVRISIDTFRSSVVRRAFDLIGDFIVNDISSGEDDPMMLDTVGRLGLQYIAMHKKGTPENMQRYAVYDDVVAEICAYFHKFSIKAESYGIRDWMLDPGFGFAKDIGQNYEILARLSEFKTLGKPLLVGVSRKSFICRPLGIEPEDSQAATQVVLAEAVRNGADVLRVHDVALTRQTVALCGLLR